MSAFKGFTLVVGVSAASIAIGAWCERHRRRHDSHGLAALSGAARILPYLDANGRLLLASLGASAPPARSLSGKP